MFPMCTGGGCARRHARAWRLHASSAGRRHRTEAVLWRARGACTHAGCVARADAVILDGLQDLPRVMAAFGLR